MASHCQEGHIEVVAQDLFSTLVSASSNHSQDSYFARCTVAGELIRSSDWLAI
jgi:hypothetical protein